MEDVQGQVDHRGIEIERVGINDLRYPIVILDRESGKQATVADITLSVGLPHDVRGTHMSRFIEVLELHRGEMTMRTIPSFLHDLKAKLEAVSAHVGLSFPFFLETEAPVSRAKAMMDYQCSFSGELNGDNKDFKLGIRVPVTSLCPCSKTISDYGAHNQRGFIQIWIKTTNTPEGVPEIVWFEELIDIAEKSASAPVFPLLKRVDEKHLTMLAYDNPVFVEDIVRNVANSLKLDSRLQWFRVHVENQESIHNHNAFAQVTWSRKDN